MAVSNAQKIAKAKYQQEKRTLIAAEVSKDKGEYYRESAAALNISLSKLIQNGVEEYIRNHGGENTVHIVDNQAQEKLTAEQRRLAEVVSKLPDKAQNQLFKFLESLEETKGGGRND